MEYNVFLSFRGEDTRKVFTGHLYQALQDKGVRAFMDEQHLEVGEPIAPNLWTAIRQSALCIVILSRQYADSRWCLMELAEMVQLQKKIIPIFYHVEPSDVRKQAGPFKEAFNSYEKRLELPTSDQGHIDEEMVRKWRHALDVVGNVKGYDVDSQYNGHEQQLIQIIVKRLLNEFRCTPMHIGKHLIGVDSRAEKVIKRLNFEAKDVKMAGICGMGGVGKTTIATIIYNRIFNKFDGSCFIKNIREHAQKESELINLQKQLIGKILGYEIPISSIEEGSALIKGRLCRKNVLIVLDDVNDRSQLDALAGGLDWFGEGSRIIITTRDRRLLTIQKIRDREIYNVELLNEEESLQLFYWHAFGRNEPPKGYAEISLELVSTTGGLPLALEVLGSDLFDRTSKSMWKEVLEKSKKIPLNEVQDRLRISYDGLSYEEYKTVFLDIVCFFIGQDRKFVIDMLKGYCYCPRLAIEALVHKSLLDIGSDNRLQMHDQIRDMGRYIIRNERAENPEMHSRLRFPEVLDVLRKQEGTDMIEAVQLQGDRFPNDRTFSTEAFANMSNLRLLHMMDIEIKGNFSIMPKNIRSLYWQFCPLDSLPKDFDIEKLGYLNLPNSLITQVWSDEHVFKTKEFKHLRFLYLFNCRRLDRCPDFSSLPNLEKVTFGKCMKLDCIPESIGHLTRLVSLDISDCVALKKLPHSLGNLARLKRLILVNAAIEELPDSIGCLANLKMLRASLCEHLRRLPESVGQLTRLKELDVYGCPSLKELPDSIGGLKNLSILLLPELKCLPNWLGCLVNLTEYRMTACWNVGGLAHLFGGLTKLEVVDFGLCDQSLAPILDFALTDLKRLSRLDFGCADMEEIPNCIGSLGNLRKLCINSGVKLKQLPDSIGNLTKLEELALGLCSSLRAFPDSMRNMKNLHSIRLVRTGTEEFLSSMASLENLKQLRIVECPHLRSPLPLWEMKGLKSLTFDVAEYGDLESRGNYFFLVGGEEADVRLVPSEMITTFRSCSEGSPQYWCTINLLYGSRSDQQGYERWELLVRVGDEERAIELKTYDLYFNRKWLKHIGDFGSPPVRLTPQSTRGSARATAGFLDKVLSCLCLCLRD